MSQKFKSEVQLEALNNATTDTDKFLVSDGGIIKYRTGTQALSDLGISALYVPYTGATGNVDLGANTLLAKDLIINHSSGSGVAASITKNGSGEALTVIKGSGSGNAMSVTGGLTSLVNLSLSTVANATGDFLTHSGGVINKRTPAQVLSDIGGQAALTNPVTGTGTTNYVTKFTGTSTVGNSLIFDNGTNVGIGTTSPSTKLHVVSSENANWTTTFENTGSQGHQVYTGYNNGTLRYGLYISGGAGNSTSYDLLVGSDKLLVRGDGNVGIGTTSPNDKLEVSGGAVRSTGLNGFIRINDGVLSASRADGLYLIQEANAPMIMWTNNTERMRITSTGNVGIGTTTPSQKLNINGSGARLLIQDTNQGASGFIAGRAASEVFLGNDGSLPLSFLVNNTERMRIDSSGNVGIGTTIFDLWGFGNYGGGSISHKSIVFGGNTYVGTQVGTDISAINFAVNNTTSSADIINRIVSVVTSTTNNSESGYLSFYTKSGAVSTASQERLRIASTGAIRFNAYGSGTFTGTATQKLAVDSSGNVIEIPIGAGPVDGSGTTNYVTKWTDADTIGNSIMFDNGTNVGIGTTSATSKLEVIGEINTNYRFKAFDGTSTLLMGHWDSTNSRIENSGGRDLFITSYGNPIKFGINGSENMRIATSGNVGIGTTSPTLKFEVDNTTTGEQCSLGIVGDSSANITNLSSKWYGTINNSIKFHRGGDATGGEMSFWTTPEGGSMLERMRIRTNGNVGIGTTSPSEKLEVSSGDISIRRNTGTWGSLRFGTNEPGYLNAWAGVESDWEGVGVNVANLKFFTSFGSRNERMRITSTGNVGIGTTSPLQKLHVNGGNALIDEIFIGTTTGFLSGTTNAQIGWAGGFSGLTNGSLIIQSRSNVATPIIFATSTTEKMRIDASGNVGIGTTIPGAKLDIVSTATGSEGLRVDGGGGGFAFVVKGGSDYTSHIRAGATIGVNYFTTPPSNGLIVEGNVGIGTTSPVAYSSHVSLTIGDVSSSRVGLLKFRSDYNGGDGAEIYQTSTGSVFFNTNSSSVFMVASANGNVGIGTTSPAAKLDVVGDGRFSARVQVQGSNGAGTTQGGLLINYNGNASSRSWLVNNDYNVYGDFAILQSTTQTGSTFTDRIYIKNDGNVGIGTSTPGAKLDVRGGSTNTEGGDIYSSNRSFAWSQYINGSTGFYSLYNGSDRFVITTSGNVGIGTTSPNRALVVVGGNQEQLVLTSTTTRCGIALNPSNTTFSPYIGSTGNDIVLDTFGSERMRITSGGNVGIGTSSPDSKLKVEGASDLFSLKMTSGGYNAITLATTFGGGNNYVINPYITGINNGGFEIKDITNNVSRIVIAPATGNVGIGSTNPQAKFEINAGSLGFTQYNYSPSQIIYTYNGNSEYVEMGSIRTAAGSDWTSSGFRIQEKIDSTWMAYMQFNGDGNNGGMSFGAGTSATSRQSIAERMRITNTGNVGIGTTSPSSLLSVAGNATFGQGTNRPVTYDSNGGNFRITPNSGGWATGYLFNGSAGTYKGGFGGFGGGDTLSYLWIGDDYNIPTITVMPNQGNVGIGTTSPNYKLSIQGNAGIEQSEEYFYFNSSYSVGSNARAKIRAVGAGGGSGYGGDFRVSTRATNNAWNEDAFIVNSSGNVGIGTTSPTEKLSVYGNARIDSDNAASQLYFYNSGTLLGSIGKGNYAVTGADFNGISMYSVGAMSFSAGGQTERMRITSLGNVGIGNTNPGNKLIVDYTTNGADGIVSRNLSTGGSAYAFVGAFNNSSNGIDLRSYPSTNLAFPSTSFVSSGSGQTGGMIINQAGGNPISLWTNGSEKMRVTSGGNIGIGTSTPSTSLEVKGTAFSVYPTIRVNHDLGPVAAYIDLIADAFAACSIDVSSGYPTVFTRGGFESMRIDGTGKVGIGISSASTRLHVRETTQGSTAMTVQVNEDMLAGAGLIDFKNNGGSTIGSIYYNGSSTSYNTSSDYRLKENVVKIDGALDRLKLLKPVKFNFISRPDITVDGFIAHEVQEVIPEAIVGVKDELDKDGKPKYQGIDHSKIVPLLTAALQEAIDKITQLEERINKLENK
jgi:hypothetical protein